MRKKAIFCLISILLACFAVFACSEKNDREAEKGNISKTVDKIADESSRGMNAALDKARALGDKAEKHVEELDETLDE